MFICQVTGRSSKPGEKMNRITVARRDKVYSRKEKNEETGRWEDIQVGHGWEIVREIFATDDGLVKWQGMSESQRTTHLEKLR